MNTHVSPAAASPAKSAIACLFVLNLSTGTVSRMDPDGFDHKTLAIGAPMPDGIAVDVEVGHVYWGNMGVPGLPDGSIERCDLDGANRVVLVPPGLTNTPKQLQLDRTTRKLYWCDREGMRVMRADLDGSNIETLVVAGDPVVHRGDATRWCVGIALDHALGQMYWTQKGPDNAGLGRIFRAGLEIPVGETAATRTDIAVWRDGLPEPIDLEFDPSTRTLYWTDRGDPPAGNTLNRAGVDAPSQPTQIILDHLMEGIGLALDLRGDRLFVTDLGGSIYTARLDGSERRVIAYAQGNLAGIAYAEFTPRFGAPA